MLPRYLKSLIGTILDVLVPIDANRVGFIAKSKVPFAGNLRILADELLRQGGRQVLVYKDGHIDEDTIRVLQQQGAIVLSGFSLFNVWQVLRCGTVFVGHTIRDGHITRRRHGRKVVNLWHGVPLKRIELLMTKDGEGRAVKSSHLRIMRANAALYDYVIASDPKDVKLMADAFGVPQSRIIAVGLPRFDYMNPDYVFPADISRQEQQLLKEANGRRIILFAPTFREHSKSPLISLNAKVIDMMRTTAKALNLVFAIRPHPYDKTDLEGLVERNSDIFLNASTTKYPEMAVVIRNTDILITDYSSILVDFSLLGKPVLALTLDIDRYKSHERGFVRPIQDYYPGPIFNNWIEAIKHIKKNLPDRIDNSISLKKSSNEISISRKIISLILN